MAGDNDTVADKFKEAGGERSRDADLEVESKEGGGVKDAGDKMRERTDELRENVQH